MKQMLMSRFGQLVAKGLMAGSSALAGLFGAEAMMDKATADDIGAFAVSALVAGIAGAWDLYVHRKETGGVTKSAGTQKETK